MGPSYEVHERMVVHCAPLAAPLSLESKAQKPRQVRNTAAFARGVAFDRYTFGGEMGFDVRKQDFDPIKWSASETNPPSSQELLARPLSKPFGIPPKPFCPLWCS